jgi:hypothetical protein
MSLDQNQAAQIAITNLSTALEQLKNTNALAIARNAALAEILQAFAKPKSVFKSGNLGDDALLLYSMPPGSAQSFYATNNFNTVAVLDISDASEVIISFIVSTNNQNFAPSVICSLSALAPNAASQLATSNEFFAPECYGYGYVVINNSKTQVTWKIPCAGNKTLHIAAVFISSGFAYVDVFSSALNRQQSFSYALIK